MTKKSERSGAKNENEIVARDIVSQKLSENDDVARDNLVDDGEQKNVALENVEREIAALESLADDSEQANVALESLADDSEQKNVALENVEREIAALENGERLIVSQNDLVGKQILRLSDEEKSKVVIVNGDGARLVFVGKNIWAPEESQRTEEENAAYFARFARPKISIVNVCAQVVAPIVASCLITICIYFFLRGNVAWANNINYLVAIAVGLVAVYAVIRARSIAIFFVKLYQIFAPMSVRERCVMTPTCSQYMIEALRKFGFCKGLSVGIKRLKRCHGEYREDKLEDCDCHKKCDCDKDCDCDKEED
ncbi:MAG: membrane protein insertion efficiency factor YidD [Clostridia bacterium]